jgi:hypothetical protein
VAKTIQVVVDDETAELIDRVRGSLSRSAFCRSAIMQALSYRAGASLWRADIPRQRDGDG